MKIGLVIYGNLNVISGGYLYDRMLCRYLQELGEQVEILSLPRRKYFQNFKDNFSRSFGERLRCSQLDILLQDELNHPSLFLLNRRLKKSLAGPIVAIVHNLRSSEKYPGWQKYLLRKIEKRYLSTVDAYIVNSLTTLEAVNQLVGTTKPFVVARPGKDHVRPNITEDHIIKRVRSPGPLRILFVGNVIFGKGLHILLEALGSLSSGDWRLDVIGSSDINEPYVESIMRQITKYKLQDEVNLLGSLSDQPLDKAFTNGDILVVPSMYEGFGIVYLEAMGFGIPCIATTSGAPKEFITPGKEGFLVDPGDALGLAKLIQKFIEDKELLLRMSLTAYKSYRAHNTWKQMATLVHEFLKRL